MIRLISNWLNVINLTGKAVHQGFSMFSKTDLTSNPILENCEERGFIHVSLFPPFMEPWRKEAVKQE